MKLSQIALAAGIALASTCALAAGAGPNDAQIAAIVVTANQVDIDAGQLAKSSSKNQEVQEFAQLMITDHGGVNKSATDLVTKLHVTPESAKRSRRKSISPSGTSSSSAASTATGWSRECWPGWSQSDAAGRYLQRSVTQIEASVRPSSGTGM